LEGYTETDEQYLIGEVSVFEDYEEDAKILLPLADDVFSMFSRVARAAHQLSSAQNPLADIPQTEPQMLSFLVSAAFSLPVEVKYDFMAMRSTIERLEKLKEILKQAVEKLEESAKISKVAKTNGHGNKKIELE